MSYKKYNELKALKQVRVIQEPCPNYGVCPEDLTSRNDCTGRYEKCPELIKIIEQGEEDI